MRTTAAILAGIAANACFLCSARPSAPDAAIEEIRFKIEEKGWRFRVERNPFFDRSLGRPLSPPLFARPVPPAAQELGPLRRFLGRTSLPPRFDWRDRDGLSYIGPIRDQEKGVCSSCYAFGACAAAEGTYNAARGLTGVDCADFSESFVMWCLGVHGPYGSLLNGCACGDGLWALEAFTRQGVVFESAFPYQTEDPGSCTHWSDETVSFQSWHLLPEGDIEAIKTAIAAFGVVLAGVREDATWDAYAGGVYEDDVSDCANADGQIGHAVSLVGWDDEPPEGGGGCWILRNQFGTDWGEGGYMRISYPSAFVSCRAAYLAYRDPPLGYRVISGSNYDGDIFGLNDIAVFRPSNGLWAVRGITRFFFGSSGDVPASGDFDGDRTTDPAVFRPGSGLWAVRGVTRACLGSAGDIAVPADYAGGGTCSIGIYRPAAGLWAVRDWTRAHFGAMTDTLSDLPVPFDYNRDGRAEIGVYRGMTGLWAFSGVTRFHFGTRGDQPLAGIAQSPFRPAVAVYRAGAWAVRGITRFSLGGPAGAPVMIADGPSTPPEPPGTVYTVFDPFQGLWLERPGGRFFFGTAGDLPASGSGK